MKLDERKMHILEAIIDDYILTATPVGSRTISKRADFNLSSATIRNEMSDLEEMGYLEQPHTSAGRIPSDKAYRLYVNEMMRHVGLTAEETKAMKAYFNQCLDEMEIVVKRTAIALSDITRYTAMILPPQLRGVRLRHLQIVPVSDDRAVMVIVTDAGLTKDAMIRIPTNIKADALDRLSKMLTKRFYNVRLDELSSSMTIELGREFGLQREFFTSIVESVQKNMAPDAHSVELSGATNMLYYPEYSDVNKVKNFLTAIEEKDTLYHLLKKAATLQFSITIGSENEHEDLKNFSVVTATYKVGDESLGSFGIIGPTRMNYGKVLSILEYMRASLSDVLTNLIEEGKN